MGRPMRYALLSECADGMRPGLHAFISPRQYCSGHFLALAIVVYSKGTASIVRGPCKDLLLAWRVVGDPAIGDQAFLVVRY